MEGVLGYVSRIYGMITRSLTYRLQVASFSALRLFLENLTRVSRIYRILARLLTLKLHVHSAPSRDEGLDLVAKAIALCRERFQKRSRNLWSLFSAKDGA